MPISAPWSFRSRHIDHGPTNEIRLAAFEDQSIDPSDALHPEVGAADRLDRFGGAADLDVRGTLSSEHVEENLAGRAAQTSSGVTRPQHDCLALSRPLDLEPRATEAPAQVPPTPTNVPPQGGLQVGRERTGPESVGTPHVLMVHEELVQVRERANPAEAKEAERRPRADPSDEPREVAAV